MNLSACPRGSRLGFSLIELLVVIAVIAVLSALVTPSIGRIVRASSLGAAGRSLVDQLSLARQTALTKNLPVEVRLYKVPAAGADPAGAPAMYRGFQTFLLNEKGDATPLAKAEFFPPTVLISPGTAESSLLADAGVSTSPHAEKDGTAMELPVYGNNYRYVPFTFKPAGETDLSAGKNFLTLMLTDDKPLAQGANYFTIQIDPANGAVRLYRP